MSQSDKYRLLVSQKTIDTYTCPICAKNDNRKTTMEIHMEEHENIDLEKAVQFQGCDANFENEEIANRFLKLLREQRCKNRDWDDHYNQSLIWTGPGRYLDHYDHVRDEYHGTYTSTSIWKKRI